MQASHVSRSPRGNNRQGRKDALSEKTGIVEHVTRRQDSKTSQKRDHTHLTGNSQFEVEQRKSCGCCRLADVITLPTANVEVTSTRWHRQHAIVVATEKVHPGGEKTAKVVTVSLSNL